MDDKEFSEKMRAHRKVRNKKIKKYGFRVVLPSIIGIFITTVFLIQAIGGGTTYYTYGTALHESSIKYYFRDVSSQVSRSIFFSPNPEISWSAHYVDDFDVPAPVRFRVRDNTLEKTYIDITTSSYEDKLSHVDCYMLDFNWYNEDESRDVWIGGTIHYELDLFWIVFFIFIGIIFIGYACISAQKIANRIKNKS
ncbi:MAG: hypothetical protein KAS07_04865 [Candidatus Pacebacteria bacterium]|nr:hypothetical protein [Candidatus Paceibacterota bacterium]